MRVQAEDHLIHRASLRPPRSRALDCPAIAAEEQLARVLGPDWARMSWVQAAGLWSWPPADRLRCGAAATSQGEGAFNRQSTHALATPVLPLRNAGQRAHGPQAHRPDRCRRSNILRHRRAVGRAERTAYGGGRCSGGVWWRARGSTSLSIKDPSREAVAPVRCRRYAAASAGRADGLTG